LPPYLRGRGVFYYIHCMHKEYDDILQRLSEIEERVEQLESTVESTAAVLAEMYEQITEIREVIISPASKFNSLSGLGLFK